MAYIFTLTNAKGGCGKTTVALNLAVCLARSGYRTLAIDLDQQGNLSGGLGVDLNKLNSTAHRLLINETAEIRRYLVEIRPQLHLIPNSIDIDADDLLEAKKVNRELLLRRQLKPVLPDFDVVVIDTPPAMRAATVNALVVADSVIIPIDSSSFALLGMNQLLKTIAAISETHNPSLKINVLTTMFNKRQNLDKIISVLETVTRRIPTKINSFRYYLKEILAVPDRRSRAWRKKQLEKIVIRIRDNSAGHADYSSIDFLEDVKCACAREAVPFDDDLFNELAG